MAVKIRTQGTRVAKTNPRASLERSVRVVRQKGTPHGPVFVHARSSRRRRRFFPLFANTGAPTQLLHPLLPEEKADLDISIIFGTYNRKALLRKCIASIRDAAQDISYEIVVADGGSRDGSPEWLESQPDVVLIRGDLSGAVPAFNACFGRSRGQFVLTLNDDATIYPDTLKNALAHMRADPMVGQIACKYLEGGEWGHQEVHGLAYANFGVIRRSVAKGIASICGGIWATCYQTYGGDTELSCWVRRLGYRVLVADDVRVNHYEHFDGLRQKNLSTDRKRSQFFHRWPSASMMKFRGPTPRVSAPEADQLARIELGDSRDARIARLADVDPVSGELPPRCEPRPERVVHLHLWTAEDPQAGLAENMRTLGNCGHHRINWTQISNPDERGRRLIEACANHQPTVVFMQLQGDHVPVEAVHAARSALRDPGAVLISWSGDVGPGQGPWHGLRDDWAYRMGGAVDLMLFTGTGQVRLHRSRGMKNAAYLQIGYDTDRYYCGPDDVYGKQHDVVFLGQNYGPHFQRIPGNDVQLRRDVVAAFRGSGLRFGLFGPSWGGPVLHQTRAGDTYRQSAMALCTSVTSDLGRYSSDRLIRSMASGCPTLIKRFADMEGWGLVDGKNCLVWDSPAQAVELARKHLGDPSRLREIGRAGAGLMAKRHTWAARLQELAAILATYRGQQWTPT